MPASIYSAVLEQCLRGEPWPRELLDHLDAPELFSVLAEGLADRFEPRLADCYADIFSAALESVHPDLRGLRERYERVRRPLPYCGPEPRDIVVLSRVTLGADVAITSVLLDALKRRFPRARVLFAGSRKAYELFAADPRVEHLPLTYHRTLRHRLWFDRDLVVDPDSRLTQLGLVPVCAEERYRLFESRTIGRDEPLSVLASRWAAEVFGVEGAQPYIAVAEAPLITGAAAVSFGVGDNPAKRAGDDFEAGVLAELRRLHAPIVVDSGATEEEAGRVRRARARSGAPARILHGSFARFAAVIAAARIYVGYDSAGQHVAAACGTPLVSLFAGYPNERFLQRWRPTGGGRIEICTRAEDALAAIRRVA